MTRRRLGGFGGRKMSDSSPSTPLQLTGENREHVTTPALGPWCDADEPPVVPRRPPRDRDNPSRPTKSPATRPQAPICAPAAATTLTPRRVLPLLDLGRVASSPPLTLRSCSLDASPVTDAYRALVEQTGALELARSQKSAVRREAAAALHAGIDNLSPALVDAQKKLLRLQALRNEVAIFQQHLDPFVFEIRSAREHEVRSSVYRHFTHMRAVQDLGVPIYGIGEYAHEPTDRVLVPRAAHRIYRRVRRRDAMHFIDADLIPRPDVGRKIRDAARSGGESSVGGQRER